MATAEKQIYNFQTESKDILKLTIHSVYSNSEIFLRELISNALDAIDKLRFLAISDPTLYEQDTDFKIQIEVDKEQHTLTVIDNGIGMTRQEVVDHLGTIAKSGTREFLASLSGDQQKDAQLIGQFGIGFYSSLIVSERVVVETRHAGSPTSEGVRWESNGEDGTYSIETIDKHERGTRVILYLRKNENTQQDNEFLNTWRLKGIIRKYSDHTPIPIQMKKDIDKSDKNAEQETTWETVNHAQALWSLSKQQITQEQYQEFYKHLSHDMQDPLIWSHNKIEGKHEYITLLYIPNHAPLDLWNHEKPRGLKLYVNRIFIMDDADAFLMRYLRFIKGIVDSKDLPLNISRELLQANQLTESIRMANTKRVLDLLADLANTQPEKYQKFWNEFGKVLKEGPIEDFSNREAIAKLLRFSSTHTDKAEQTISLMDYCARMKPEQKNIYYIIAEHFISAQNSPHLEIFRQKGIEVLLLSDRIDEWLVAHLTEFDGKPLQSVAKDADISGISELEIEKKPEEPKDDLKSLLEQFKNALGDRVKEVRLSQRLTTSPACVVSEQNALSAHMQRLLQAAGQALPENKPILELNPDHKLIQHLKSEQDDARVAQWALILLEQSILAEGGQLEDASGFVKRLNAMFEDLV